MLVLRETNTLCYADQNSEDGVLDWLDDTLTFHDEKPQYVRRRGIVTRVSDGTPLRLLHRNPPRFAAGLLPHVLVCGKRDDVAVQRVDQRTPEFQRDPHADLAWLHDYQRAAVDKALRYERGILHMPTGSGKTECAVAIDRAYGARYRVLFVAHRAQLAVQARDRFAARGVPDEELGLFAQGAHEQARVTFATYQSLLSDLTRAPRGGPASTLLLAADMLLADECHTAPAETFARVLSACHARVRIGLSATPLARGDGRSVLAVAHLGPVIHRVTAAELVAAGRIARPEVVLLPCSQSYPFRSTSWTALYRRLVTDSTKRNGIVVQAVRECEKPALVFVQHVEHGKRLARELGRAGMNVEFVWGTHSVAWRKSRIRDLERGALDAIVTSAVMQEGVDIPSVRTVVIAAGGKSTIAAIQRAGRGMRTAPGKATFTVIDIADSDCKPLERHARARAAAYRREGYELRVETKYLTAGGTVA